MNGVILIKNHQSGQWVKEYANELGRADVLFVCPKAMIKVLQRDAPGLRFINPEALHKEDFSSIKRVVLMHWRTYKSRSSFMRNLFGIQRTKGNSFSVIQYITLLRGPWNEALINEMRMFPNGAFPRDHQDPPDPCGDGHSFVPPRP